MFEKYLDFTWRDIWITSSEAWISQKTLRTQWEPNTMGLAQIVYRTKIEWKDLVVKILRELQQETFKLKWENDFTNAEFYFQCLQAIEKSWSKMPDFYDVLNLKSYDETNILAFLQTYIPWWIYDDIAQKKLPNLSLIEWWKKRWFWRCFNEWFYSKELDEFIFLDWDKYLGQLKRIAENKWIKTRNQLKDFCIRIENSL